jgi:hypothetical protein
MWRIGRAAKSIPIYSFIQQDVTSHSLFISGNCSTCFGWYFHPSSGAHTTVSTASGICHNVTAICRYRGRVGTGLSVLWVAYAHKEMLPICAAFLCGYPLLHSYFCPQKTHNATPFYRGTCIQGRSHLVTAATSVQSCAYRSSCVTIKLDSAAI